MNIHTKSFLFTSGLFIVGALQASAMTCEIKVQNNIQYGSGTMSKSVTEITQDTTQVPLMLDTYIPTTCDGKVVSKNLKPVIWVHGGGFSGGDKSDPAIVRDVTALAQEGFPVFSINYRLTPNQREKNTMPVDEVFTSATDKAFFANLASKLVTETIATGNDQDQNFYGSIIAMEDTVKAEKWLKSQASVYGIDPTRIGLIGESAGAGTVLSTAYVADDLGVDNMSPLAVVDLFGTTRPFSAMEQGEASLLIIHGTEDPTVPYAEAGKLLDQATSVGIPVERVPMIGAGHGIGGAMLTSRTYTNNGETLMQYIAEFYDANLNCNLTAWGGRLKSCPSTSTQANKTATLTVEQLYADYNSAAGYLAPKNAGVASLGTTTDTSSGGKNTHTSLSAFFAGIWKIIMNFFGRMFGK